MLPIFEGKKYLVSIAVAALGVNEPLIRVNSSDCIFISSVSIDENIYTSGAAVTVPGLTFDCSDADAIDTLTYSLTSGSTTIWDVTSVAGSLQ